MGGLIVRLVLKLCTTCGWSAFLCSVPDHLKPTSAGRVSGHSGRRSMVTTAINSGVDAVVVSNASQHRDVNTLRGYVDSGSSASVALARAISGAMMVESDQEVRVHEGGDSDSSEGIRYGWVGMVVAFLPTRRREEESVNMLSFMFYGAYMLVHRLRACLLICVPFNF